MGLGSRTTIPSKVRTQRSTGFLYFDAVSIDISSPCPPERRAYGTDAFYSNADAPGLGDYADEIDEYPEYGEHVGINGDADPAYWGPGNGAL